MPTVPAGGTRGSPHPGSPGDGCQGCPRVPGATRRGAAAVNPPKPSLPSPPHPSLGWRAAHAMCFRFNLQGNLHTLLCSFPRQPGSASPPWGQVPICQQLQFLNIFLPPSSSSSSKCLRSRLCSPSADPKGHLAFLRAFTAGAAPTRAQGRMQRCGAGAGVGASRDLTPPTSSKGRRSGSAVHSLAQARANTCLPGAGATADKGRVKAGCLLSARG